MKTCLVTKVRNEGVYMLEWIAHHKLIGFDDIIVISNDLSDSSDIMLKSLDDAGVVIWKDVSNIPLKGRRIGVRAYRQASEMISESDYDWVMELDADEFLDLNGVGIKDFLSNFEDSDAIVFNWMNFGCSGNVEYDPGSLVMERFFSCLGEEKVGRNEVKSIVKKNRLKELAAHISHFNDGKVKVSHSGGESFIGNSSADAREKVYRSGAFPVDYSQGKVRHYTTKSVDEYMLRMQRGLGGALFAGENPKYNFSYFKRRNEGRDECPVPSDYLELLEGKIESISRDCNLLSISKLMSDKAKEEIEYLRNNGEAGVKYKVLHAMVEDGRLPDVEEAMSNYFMFPSSIFFKELIVDLAPSSDSSVIYSFLQKIEEVCEDEIFLKRLKKGLD